MKKIFSIVLVFVMVFAVFIPSTALADTADTGESVAAALTTDGEVYVWDGYVKDSDNNAITTPTVYLSAGSIDPKGIEVPQINITMQFPHEELTWGDIKSRATVTSEDLAISEYELVLCERGKDDPLDDSLVFSEGQTFTLYICNFK